MSLVSLTVIPFVIFMKIQACIM